MSFDFAKHYVENKEVYRERHLKLRYGIDLCEFEAMLDRQGGGCAICRKAPDGKHLDVDHDHVTGATRGLLCRSCNITVGGHERALADSRFRDYLETHRGE